MHNQNQKRKRSSTSGSNPASKLPKSDERSKGAGHGRATRSKLNDRNHSDDDDDSDIEVIDVVKVEQYSNKRRHDLMGENGSSKPNKQQTVTSTNGCKPPLPNLKDDNFQCMKGSSGRREVQDPSKHHRIKESASIPGHDVYSSVSKEFSGSGEAPTLQMQPAIPGPSSSTDVFKVPHALPPKKEKKTLQTEKEKQLTIGTRKIRAAIMCAMHEMLEKAEKNDLNEDRLDELYRNLKSCLINWPNIFTLWKCPRYPESIAGSHELEIIEFARWWLFGLPAVFFAVPDSHMTKTNIMHQCKIMCQHLVNGHPQLVHSLAPQLIGILRDLTGTGVNNNAVVVKLSRTKRDSELKTCNYYTFRIKVNNMNYKALVQYLIAISPLLPTVVSYNHTLHPIFLDVLNGLSKRIPLHAFATILSSFYLSMMPSTHLLTYRSLADSLCTVLKPVAEPYTNESDLRKLFANCDVKSVISSLDMEFDLLPRLTDILYSKQLGVYYYKGIIGGSSLQTTIEHLLGKLVWRNSSNQMPSLIANVGVVNGHYPEMELHPIVAKAIKLELTSSADQMGHPTINAQNSSPTWAKMVKSWEKALANYASQTQLDIHGVFKFLSSTHSFIKVAKIIFSSLDNQEQTYHFFKSVHLQQWFGVVEHVLTNMNQLQAVERHAMYSLILKTLGDFDCCRWFNINLNMNLLIISICVPGWSWLTVLKKYIPAKRLPTFCSSNISFISNSRILQAEAVKTLQLNVFRPWKKFVIEVCNTLINSDTIFNNPFLTSEILCAIANVNWPMKLIPFQSTLRFMSALVTSTIWKVEPHVRSCIGDAIASLPCIICSNFFFVQGQSQSTDVVSSNGCRICSAKRRQDVGNILELNSNHCMTIIAVAEPILHSKFLPVKLTIVDLIRRCNNHMKTPSAVMASSMLGSALQGKTNFCRKVFKTIAVLLLEEKVNNLENGCPNRAEVAQKVFFALNQVCGKILKSIKKSVLPLATRVKLLFGIYDLSSVGSMSLHTFVEIFKCILLILSQTGYLYDESENTVVLLCQKVVSRFAEAHKCASFELVTKIRREVSRQLIKIAIFKFYRLSAPSDIEQVKACVRFISIVKNVCSFSRRSTFINYFYPCLMEQLVPNLKSTKSYHFILLALSKYGETTLSMVLQDSVSMWYPSLLLDSSFEVVTNTQQLLKNEYKFDSIVAAKAQDKQILDEALSRLHDREDKVLRFLSHLCKWDDNSCSQVIFSQGSMKAPTRTEIKELLDKRILGFFLHFDTKVNSRIETIETKINILKSFNILLKLMGKPKITELRSKIYQTLNSVTQRGPQFHDVLLDSWKIFVKCLENEVLPIMTCPIVAALLPLRQNPSSRVLVDGLVSHIVCFRSETTKVQHHKLYFLQDQCDDESVTNAINSAVTKMKEENWTDYFKMLVEEANHRNSHIRYQAFRCLHQIVNRLYTHVEKYVIGRGEKLVSKVISTCLAGLRSTTSGKPEDEKAQLEIASCFGCFGALDPSRFQDEHVGYYDFKTNAGLVTSGQITTFCVMYLQELLREFQDAKDATNFDFCVCLIRDLIRDLNVKQENNDPIWGKLSKESQEIVAPMINHKYAFQVTETLGQYSFPIYLSDHGKCFEDWLRNWLTSLIRYITTEDHVAHNLFVKNLFLLRKNIRIAAFILPFLTMRAIFCAKEEQLLEIVTEMRNILDRWTILEKRKAKSNEPIRDSEVEAEADVVEEPLSVEIESVFHFRCTQVILAVLDQLGRSLKWAEKYWGLKEFQEQAQVQQGRRIETPKTLPPMTKNNIQKVKFVLAQIPATLISQVSFDSQASETALFYLEQELALNPSDENLQHHLDFLQRIHLSLNDMDSVIGVSAVRKEEPSSHELVLLNIALGKVDEYVKDIERLVKCDPNNLVANYGLVQTYLSLEEPVKAQNTIKLALSCRPEWKMAFQEVQMESLIKQKSWSDLAKEVDSFDQLTNLTNSQILEKKSLTWNVAIARTISKLERNKLDEAWKIVKTLRERLVAPLIAASEEIHPYQRAYDDIVQLHVLAEIEDAIRIMQKYDLHVAEGKESLTQGQLFQDVKRMTVNWDLRLKSVSKSRKTVDQILKVRQSVYQIMKGTFCANQRLCDVLNASIRESWLDIAKDSSKCGNFIRADNALLEANEFLSPTVFIQEAKLLQRKGKKELAIAVLQKGINEYFPQRGHWVNASVDSDSPTDTENRILCSKALLLQTRLYEDQKSLDMQEYIDKYRESIGVYKECEKGFFVLGSYFDSLYVSIRDKDLGKGNPAVESDVNKTLVNVVRNYSQSLVHGCKYVYQSLPRLLFIWFNFASEFQNLRAEASKRTTSSTAGNLNIMSWNEALSNMHYSIEKLVKTVPAYVLLTAFSQLISRLCHSHTETWNLLNKIIVSIIRAYPHQALWMTVAVKKSVNKYRKTRCAQIYASVEKEVPSMSQIIKDYSNLSEIFLKLSEKKTLDKNKSTATANLSDVFPQLPKYIRNMGNVMVPFQIYMNYSLPSKGVGLKHHEAFPESLVYISDIENRIDIMASLVRPKKLTLVGSNGKRYPLLCKPQDDLRKDSKVMEVNNVVNWYLGQKFESRERRLHVRTYSVVPLNEECGLLEWVPNLHGLRHVIIGLHKERNNRFPQHQHRSLIALEDPLSLKKHKFENELLKISPPVLKHWFFNTFGDHQSWYLARMSYMRTAAVISIVGYIMGLGDRHGENILLDSNTGEVQHVDFNCLFNKGESFAWPERVPFRLTRNMVDAMGPLKHEGVFRRSCEIVMKMFRNNQNAFLSVLGPFVHDPLVEWQVKVGSLKDSGEACNATAVDTVKYIRYRLNGSARNMQKDINTELSVEAQVKYLIDEATSHDNLCQMFYGWGAYF